MYSEGAKSGSQYIRRHVSLKGDTDHAEQQIYCKRYDKNEKTAYKLNEKQLFSADGQTVYKVQFVFGMQIRESGHTAEQCNIFSYGLYFSC